jgi:hypothetical protein
LHKPLYGDVQDGLVFFFGFFGVIKYVGKTLDIVPGIDVVGFQLALQVIEAVGIDAFFDDGFPVIGLESFFDVFGFIDKVEDDGVGFPAVSPVEPAECLYEEFETTNLLL